MDPVADGIARLLSTGDRNTRNQLALDLAETGNLRVKSALISLILRPELRNERGTLVYALERFDCSDQAPFLLELVKSGNYEVALQAASIIEGTAQFPETDVGLLMAGFTAVASAASEDWRREFAENLLAR